MTVNKICVECNCHSDEHRAFFGMFDERDLIYMHIFLTDYDNLFVRIWKAIKYIFGYKCKYGHWDEFLLSKKEAGELIEMLNQLKDPELPKMEEK